MSFRNYQTLREGGQLDGMSNLCVPAAIDCSFAKADLSIEDYEYGNQVSNNPVHPHYRNGVEFAKHFGKTVFGDHDLSFPYYAREFMANGNYDTPDSEFISRPAGISEFVLDDVDEGYMTKRQAHLCALLLNAAELGWTILPYTRSNHVEGLVRVGKFSFVFRGVDSYDNPHENKIYSIHDLAGTEDAEIQDEVAPLPLHNIRKRDGKLLNASNDRSFA